MYTIDRMVKAGVMKPNLFVFALYTVAVLDGVGRADRREDQAAELDGEELQHAFEVETFGECGRMVKHVGWLCGLETCTT